MVKRFILYIFVIISFQFSFLIMNASDWTYPLSTFLFLLLVLVEVIIITNKKMFKDPYVAVAASDPSTDLETAKRVQEALLSIDPPYTDNIKIVRRCVPASTLGGDFYTFVNKTLKHVSSKSKQQGIVELVDKHENLIGVTVGDVAGHGVSSALVMALSSGLLGRIGQNNRSPAVILQRANVDIQKFISQSHISHVTAFYSTINLDEMTITYAGAGHPPGIIVRPDLTYELLESNGIFLGMYPDEVYHEQCVKLTSGERILLFTDGIIDTINKEREEFGMKRLIDLALINFDKEPEDLVELVFEQLYKYREGHTQRDDQTLVVVDIN